MPAGAADSSRCGRTGLVLGPGSSSMPPDDGPTSTTAAPDNRLHENTVALTTARTSEEGDEVVDMEATFRCWSGGGAAAGEPQPFDSAATASERPKDCARERGPTTADHPRRPCPPDPSRGSVARRRRCWAGSTG